jgi:hypothetical protein
MQSARITANFAAIFAAMATTAFGGLALAQGDARWSPSTSGRFDGVWLVTVEAADAQKPVVRDARLEIHGAEATYEAFEMAQTKYAGCANRAYPATVEQRAGRPDEIRVKITRSQTLAGCTDISWPFRLVDGKLVWDSATQHRSAVRK